MKVDNAIISVGIEIIVPYFMKSINEYLTLYFDNKFVNIIPASAPRGVKKAPILEPIMEA